MTTKTYTKFAEQLKEAQSKDIVAIAQSLGMNLEKNGQYYSGKWQGHDTFQINPRKNTFNWYGRGFGGGVIDLVSVLQFGAMDEETKKQNFRQSVAHLVGAEVPKFDASKLPVQKSFYYYLEDSPNMNLAIKYLKEERGLSDETISFFISQEAISQSVWSSKDKDGKEYNEPVVVFKNKDFNGNIVGGSVQGIEEHKERHTDHASGHLKRVIKNSGAYSGLAVDIGKPNRIIVAESPIDLMSYYELHKENLQDVRLISADGYKPQTYSTHLLQVMARNIFVPNRPTKKVEQEQWLKQLDVDLSQAEASPHSYFDKEKGRVITDGEYLAHQDYSNLDVELREEMKAMDLERIHSDYINYGLMKMTQDQPLIVFAYDNDKAGQEFVERFKKDYPQLGKYTQKDFPPLITEEEKNDWNNELKRRKGATQMAEKTMNQKEELGVEIPELKEPLLQAPGHQDFYFQASDLEHLSGDVAYSIGEGKLTTDIQEALVWSQTNTNKTTELKAYLSTLENSDVYDRYFNTQTATSEEIKMVERWYSEHNGVLVSDLKDQMARNKGSQTFMANTTINVEKIAEEVFEQHTKSDSPQKWEAMIEEQKDREGMNIDVAFSQFANDVWESMSEKLPQDQPELAEEFQKRYEQFFFQGESVGQLSRVERRRQEKEEGLPALQYSQLAIEWFVEKLKSYLATIKKSAKEFLEVSPILRENLKARNYEGIAKFLKDDVRKFTNKDNLRNYLEFISKFPKYSFQNSQLILAQNPNVSRLADAETWERLGRKISEDQRAITVVAPKVNMNGADEKPLINSDGEFIKGQSYSFNALYDISQTVGSKQPPVPLHMRQESLDDRTRYAKLYDSIIKIVPFKVSMQEIVSDSNVVKNDDYSFTIRQGLGYEKTVESLLYLAAYQKLAEIHKGQDTPARQFEAEAMTVILGERMGVDTRQYSLDAHAQWTGAESSMLALQHSMENITTQSEKMIVNLDKSLKETFGKTQTHNFFEERLAQEKQQTVTPLVVPTQTQAASIEPSKSQTPLESQQADASVQIRR